jgi:hypothetical protein
LCLGDPGIDANDVDGDRCEDVLQRCLDQTGVPAFGQAENPDAMRQGAFDSGALTVEPSPFLRRLALAYQGLVLEPGRQRDGARCCLQVGTRGSHWASGAGCLPEADEGALDAVEVPGRLPVRRHFSLGTRRRPGILVDPEGGGLEPPLTQPIRPLP